MDRLYIPELCPANKPPMSSLAPVRRRRSGTSDLHSPQHFDETDDDSLLPPLDFLPADSVPGIGLILHVQMVHLSSSPHLQAPPDQVKQFGGRFAVFHEPSAERSMSPFHPMRQRKVIRPPSPLRPLLPKSRTVRHFVCDLFYDADFSPEVMLYALALVDRLLDLAPVDLDARNWRGMYTTAVFLAQKMVDDKSYDAQQFAKVCTLRCSPKRIAQMELAFLGGIHFDAYVSAEEYAKYNEDLAMVLQNVTRISRSMPHFDPPPPTVPPPPVPLSLKQPVAPRLVFSSQRPVAKDYQWGKSPLRRSSTIH